MRAVRAKKILVQARKNARTGKVASRKEYDRLKKEYKTHTQKVKQKLTARQERRKDIVANEQKPAVKSKAHRYPRVRIQTKFGYRTL